MSTQFSRDFTFPIPMTKMSGTGNDFIIIDHRQPFIPKEHQARFAQLVCRRKISAGADGLILIEKNSDADFQWQFYNADGSAAEMCGNGARCAARFAYVNKIASANMRFQTTAGVIEAEVVNEAVRIKLTTPADIRLGQSIVLDGQEKNINSVNTGVPHVVHFVDDISQALVEKWGRFIRFHEMFQPAGTNVNFVEIRNHRHLYVRTYERGVEGETLACGTGAVASAIIAGLYKKVESPVEITTSGGEKLVIHYTLNGDTPDILEVFLEGPARFIYQAQLTAEALAGI